MTDAPYSAAAERTERDMRFLDEITEHAMRGFRSAAYEAESIFAKPPEDRPAADPSVRVARYVRMVGQIVALKQKIANRGFKPLPPGEDPRKAEVRRRMHQAAASDPATIRRRDGLRVEIDYKIDALDIGAFLGSVGSIDAVVACLCESLGVAPPDFSFDEPDEMAGETDPDDDPDGPPDPPGPPDQPDPPGPPDSPDPPGPAGGEALARDPEPAPRPFRFQAEIDELARRRREYLAARDAERARSGAGPP